MILTNQLNTGFQEIWIPGRAVGKARPRFYKGTVYTENRYGNWKKRAVKNIKSLRLDPAPKPCFVECFFVNFFSSDSDNLTAAVLDSMIEASFLTNDSSRYVIGCSGLFVKQRKPRNETKPIGVLVRVYSASIQWLEDIQRNVS